jgi:hypothetical protein
MSDEIKTDPTTTTTPTSKPKRWWLTIPFAAVIAALTGVLWPSGETKQDDMPLLIIHSVLQTNWEATIQSSHDPRLPVTVLTMTNGTLATNMMNLNVRRAEIYRASLLGVRRADGVILPVAQAAVLAGTIAQTNGIDATVLTQFQTNK